MMDFIFSIGLFFISAVFFYAVINEYFRVRYFQLRLDMKHRFWGSLIRYAALLGISGICLLVAVYLLNRSIIFGTFN